MTTKETLNDFRAVRRAVEELGYVYETGRGWYKPVPAHRLQVAHMVYVHLGGNGIPPTDKAAMSAVNGFLMDMEEAPAA